MKDDLMDMIRSRLEQATEEELDCFLIYIDTYLRKKGR